MCWRLLAVTGMRRDEALALRWRDVDLDTARIAVRRSVRVVQEEDAGPSSSSGYGQVRAVTAALCSRG